MRTVHAGLERRIGTCIAFLLIAIVVSGAGWLLSLIVPSWIVIPLLIAYGVFAVILASCMVMSGKCSRAEGQ